MKKKFICYVERKLGNDFYQEWVGIVDNEIKLVGHRQAYKFDKHDLIKWMEDIFQIRGAIHIRFARTL